MLGGFDYYAGYQYFEEDGWRDYSPSHLNQFFSKLGWEDDATRAELTYTGAHNKLIGNGLAPKYLLGSDNEGINTVPDETKNNFGKLNLSVSHFFDDDTMLSANAYWKRSDSKTWNGDGEIEIAAEDNISIVSGGPFTIGDDSVTLFSYDDPDLIDAIGVRIEKLRRSKIFMDYQHSSH